MNESILIVGNPQERKGNAETTGIIFSAICLDS